MHRFGIFLLSLLAAVSFTDVKASLSASGLLGYDTTPHDALLVQELGNAITNTKEQCANDVELFCSPEREIFLAFGSGITIAAKTTIFYSEEDNAAILLSVFSYGNRRLQAYSDHDAHELDEYMHLLVDNRPIYGFGKDKDTCLQTILRGINPTDSSYVPPVLSQKCTIAARTVNDRYIDISRTVDENDFYEFVSFTAISVVALLSIIASFLALRCFFSDSSERIDESESSICTRILSVLKYSCLGLIVSEVLIVVFPKFYFVIIPCFLSTLCFTSFMSFEEDDEVYAHDYVALDDKEEEEEEKECEELVYIGVPLRVV